jgi:hypothetical protein
MEITVKLLEKAMRDALDAGRTREGWADGRGRFLVDGFPRKMDQAVKFEEDVCKSALVLFYTTTEQVMLDRLLERGKTSGREDDNIESIKKRFGEDFTANVFLIVRSCTLSNIQGDLYASYRVLQQGRKGCRGRKIRNPFFFVHGTHDVIRSTARRPSTRCMPRLRLRSGRCTLVKLGTRPLYS